MCCLLLWEIKEVQRERGLTPKPSSKLLYTHRKLGPTPSTLGMERVLFKRKHFSADALIANAGRGGGKEKKFELQEAYTLTQVTASRCAAG